MSHAAAAAACAGGQEANSCGSLPALCNSPLCCTDAAAQAQWVGVTRSLTKAAGRWQEEPKLAGDLYVQFVACTLLQVERTLMERQAARRGAASNV